MEGINIRQRSVGSVNRLTAGNDYPMLTSFMCTQIMYCTYVCAYAGGLKKKSNNSSAIISISYK